MSTHSENPGANGRAPSDNRSVTDVLPSMPLVGQPTASRPFLRSDPAWLAAATAYRQALNDVKVAEAAEIRAKEALVALIRHSVECGCGVTVTKSLTWTADDEMVAVKELGVDLARYYGKGCFGVTIVLDE